MGRSAFVLLFSVAGSTLPPLLAADREVVFRSDVSLVRVDAQVVDRNNRTIAGLRAEDFVLREEGRLQQIRNFSSENMPVDVVLLLDVSASMRPHVERIASAAHQALRVLADEDRVAIMVFDRATRLRLPFRNSRSDVERELESLLRQETFRGGTDITRALLDAADYVAREGRREARRAIVILTDDQTERNRDEDGVSRALAKADAVLSGLIAPDAMAHAAGAGRGPWGGGSSPGGIILRRRGPYGGRGPGPVMRGPRTQSAGTAEISRRSGGDSMPVDDASALETTLARIRQRYALHFYLPDGVQPGQERDIQVDLAEAARRRYPDAEVRYRRVYLTPNGNVASEPATVTRGSSTPRRRRGVSQAPDGSREGPLSGPSEGGWRRVDDPAPESGGWRRLKPGELP
jgi:VWFA-related protein